MVLKVRSRSHQTAQPRGKPSTFSTEATNNRFTNMKLAIRPRYVCQLCRLCRTIQSQKRIARYATAAPSAPSDHQLRAATPATRSSSRQRPHGFWENQWTIFSADNAALVKKAQQLGDDILNSKAIPSEDATLEALRVIESAAQQLSYHAKSSSTRKAKGDDNSAASSLLSLDSTKTSEAHPASISIAVELLSTLAHKIIAHPPVYITQPILNTYVSVQSTLHRPQSFPDTFALYASKPAPIPSSSNPIRYKAPNPDTATQAIPVEIAGKALGAAIQAKDMPLALDIIATTYTTPAFRRNKFVRKALPPLALFGFGVPLGALTLALQLPYLSNIPDPLTNVIIGFTGIMTYTSAVGVLGFVAITTRNDQMERVTWVTGMPLRERWIREEERAAIDRVALAWGFKERERWGEEESPEWEELKEWAGRRGMWLDRVEFMDGME